jgi:hypothetical protein
MTTPTEPEQLINLITHQTERLLQNHWADIESYRDGDEEIKIGFSHKLSYSGSERTVKTAISFSHRVKDELEQSIDTEQADLPLKVTIRKGRTNE